MKKNYLLSVCFYIYLSSLPVILGADTGASAAAASSLSGTATVNRSLVIFDRGPDNLGILQRKYHSLAEAHMDKKFDESEDPLMKQLGELPAVQLFDGITNGTMLTRLNGKEYDALYTAGISSAEQLSYEMLYFSSAVSKIPYETLCNEVCMIKTLAGKQNKLKEIITKSDSFQGLSLLQKVVCLRRLDPSRTIFEDIVLVAFTIRETRLKQGQAPILFMGRSPAFFKVVYERLDKFYSDSDGNSSWSNPCLSLSFSGTPDAETLRDDELFADKEKNAVRNMVTKEKLAFYMNYMDEQGMGNVGEKLYLVENINTAGGLVSMLRVLRYYYQVYLKRPIMPDVTLLGMGILFGTSQKVKTWERSAETSTLTIDAKVDGMPKVQIKSHPLQVSNTVLRCLDVPLLQYYFCKEVSFPAYNWRESYKKVIARGGAHHALFYEWLREETVKTVKGYENEAVRAAKTRFRVLANLAQPYLPDVN